MITESGKVIADTLYDALPLTIREKSLEAMSKLINRRHVSKQNKTRIEACDKGYHVTCTVCDETMETMSVKVYVPTYNYATVVRDRFLDDPETRDMQHIPGVFGTFHVKSAAHAFAGAGRDLSRFRFVVPAPDRERDFPSAARLHAARAIYNLYPAGGQAFRDLTG